MNFLKNIFAKRRERMEKEKADKLAEAQRLEKEKADRLVETRRMERETFIRNSLAKLIPNNQSKDGYIEKNFSIGNLSDIMNFLASEWDNIKQESLFEYENQKIVNSKGSTATIFLYNNVELVRSIPSYEVMVRNFIEVSCLSSGLFAYKIHSYKKPID